MTYMIFWFTSNFAILKQKFNKQKFSVQQSTHDALQSKYDALESKYDAILRVHRTFVLRVDSLGGEDFLVGKKIHPNQPKQQKPVDHDFTDDDLRKMIQLCHPDKHGGKESATYITSKLNRMRNE